MHLLILPRGKPWENWPQNWLLKQKQAELLVGGDYVPLHASFWESWGCRFLWVSWLGWILSSPSPLSLLSTQSYPCRVGSYFSNVQWTVSKKDVPTRAGNILLPWSAFPQCFTANGVSSPGPTPAQGWGTAKLSMLKEKWKIRSMSSGWARMMALQREIEFCTGRIGTPPRSE